jgi:hypothetical protein
MVTLFIFPLVIFPAALVWAWKSGSHRRLFAVSALLLLLLVPLSFALASPRFGNRLADSEGYLLIASRILMLMGLHGALPIIGVALFISLAGEYISRVPVLYAMSLGVTAITWTAGLFLSFYVLWGG